MKKKIYVALRNDKVGTFEIFFDKKEVEKFSSKMNAKELKYKTRCSWIFNEQNVECKEIENGNEKITLLEKIKIG